MTPRTICRCGNYDLGNNPPHTVNGDPAEVSYQVMGAPQYGREAHTVRECYREVPVSEAWAAALAEWKESLAEGRETTIPAPMPVGHIMFNAIPGSPALSRRDNAARARSERAS
jgi:hypothetical protein